MSLAELLAIAREPDFADAPCREIDPDLFVPEYRHTPAEKAVALSACARCPLVARRACARLAVRTNVRHGIWAGVHLHTKNRAEAVARLEEIAGEPVPPMARWLPESRRMAQEVQRLTNRGLTAAEIAIALRVTERTVERWRARLKAVAS